METPYSVTKSSSKSAAICNSGERINNIYSSSWHLVFLCAFGTNCLNICVVAFHKTHHRRVMDPTAFSVFRVSLLVVPVVTGPRGCSSSHFFFCFVQGWEFFQSIHEHTRGNVPRESNGER